MKHPETHTLLAHVDGELPDAEEHAVTLHLAHCTECSSALATLRASGALVARAVQARDAVEPAHWDDPLPTVSPRESAKVIPLMNGNRPRRQAAERGRYTERGPSWLRWAAGIVLVTATAASAIVLRTALTDDREPAITDSVPTQPAPPREEAAVIVQPREGTVRVSLSNVGVGSRVLVTSEDRADASIAVTSISASAAAPHFTAEDGRVAIDARGAVAQLHVVLPRALRHASVTLDGATLVTVRGAQVSPAHAATTGVLVDAVSTPRME